MIFCIPPRSMIAVILLYLLSDLVFNNFFKINEYSFTMNVSIKISNVRIFQRLEDEEKQTILGEI